MNETIKLPPTQEEKEVIEIVRVAMWAGYSAGKRDLPKTMVEEIFRKNIKRIFGIDYE